MGRSLLVMGALMGSDVRLTGPDELLPPKDVVDIATDIAGRTGARITITDDPAEAVAGADFIHTDVWVSMGESKDVWDERVQLLTPYQVNAALLRQTGNPAVKFMHCLPAFHDMNTVVGREMMEHTGMTSGLEVTDEVFQSGASIVFDQAENRLHTIKAIPSLPSASSSPLGQRPHMMAGVAHPSGVMPPVRSNDVVLVYPPSGLANAEAAGSPQRQADSWPPRRMPPARRMAPSARLPAQTSAPTATTSASG